jgi:hypothetical protein
VAFGEELAGFDGDETAEGVDFGAELFAEEADELAAFGGGDVAPLEEGDVGLGDGFARGFGRDGRELRDDFAGDGGADGEGAGGRGGDSKLGEDGLDFLLDGHGVSADVDGVVAGGVPPQGYICGATFLLSASWSTSRNVNSS